MSSSITLIDNIFTNHFEHIINSGLLFTFLDHFSIFHIFLTKNSNKPQNNLEEKNYYHKFTKRNVNLFKALTDKVS